MKYHGTYEEFKEMVDRTGEVGTWKEDSQKVEYRTKANAVMNSWPKTGTIHFQGPKDAAARLRAKVEESPADGVDVPAKPMPVKGAAKSIFVVPGHDIASREQLKLMLLRLDLEPFVLANTAGGGMTIIEALESQLGKHGAAAFGVVLLTPDDVCYAKSAGSTAAQDRARQNVILEMGMLLSSLTRERVAILVKGHVELPSDAHGVIYLHVNDHVKQVVPKLCERLQEAGFEFTPQQISRAAQ